MINTQKNNTNILTHTIMKKLLLILILFISISGDIFSQAGMCEDSDPFCTGNIYTFPAGVGTGTAQSGPNYGCLGSQPNPAWYHMKIAEAGDINIYMSTVPLKDIDFICWGPFDDPEDPCASSLTNNMIVDCSYSADPTENCYIPNGLVGEYYILLITNFSNSPCDITFQKTFGSGETDCTIVPPPVSNNSPLCTHENLELYADDYTNATYAWTGPAGFTSTQQNPIIQDVTPANAGLYILVITVNGSASDAVQTLVTISALPTPDFDVNEACFGDTTFFIDQSTTDPDTYPITSWNWEFGDGAQASGQNQQYTYGNVGSYDATLTTYTGFGQCGRSITKSVIVNSAASVSAGDDVTIPNGWTTGIDGDVSGGSGDYDLLWQPENLLEDATIVDPTTVALGATAVFTLNVTDASSGCTSKDSMTVIVTGGALQVSASANPTTICQDEIVNLNALPSGGSGNNGYSWTSNPAGFTADIKEPSDYPQVTTTYTVSVFDGQNTVQASVTVNVKPRPIGDAGNDKTITVGTTTTIDGSSASGGSGDFSYIWSPINSLVNPTSLHPETVILDQSTDFFLTVNDANGCSSVPNDMRVITGGLGLNAEPYSSAMNETICQGESVELYPGESGGGENKSYKWYIDGDEFFVGKIPVVSPWETTTYTVEIDDTFKTVYGDVTIIVNHTPVVDLIPSGSVVFGDTILVCVRDSVVLDATDPINPPIMNYLWSTTATNPTITSTTNGSWIDYKTYSVSVENPVTTCLGRDTITVMFSYSECDLGINDNNPISQFITITPNPTSEKSRLHIKGLSGSVSIALSNIQGAVIWQKNNIEIKNNSYTQDISLKQFSDGVYLISVVHKLGIYNSRLIKQ